MKILRDWIKEIVEPYGEIELLEEKEKYREFASKEEADEWGYEIYGEWGEKYKQYQNVMRESHMFEDVSDVYSVLECYCGYKHREINDYKRTGNQEHFLSNKIRAELLPFILLSAPRIPEDIVVYRMVDEDFFNILIDANKKTEHHYYYEKGFMSTSLVKDIAFQDAYKQNHIMLKLYVSRGIAGAYVNTVTRRDEYELLLQNNLFIRLCGKPYIDPKVGKRVYECYLHTFKDENI